MDPAKVILAPDGFPWCAVISWVVFVASVMTFAMTVIGVSTVGGTFVIAALLGNAVCAAVLGRC